VDEFKADSCHRQQPKLIECFDGIGISVPKIEVDVLSVIYVHDVEVNRKAIVAQPMVVTDL
jgi:hypothetical protein